MSTTLNVFRSFEGIWRNFDRHELYLHAKTDAGFRCFFCQIRSVSLRLNRAKKRTKLKPVEILSQMDQLQSSKIMSNDFKTYFFEILKLIDVYEPNFAKARLTSPSTCKLCIPKTQASFKMHASLDDIHSLKNNVNVQDVLDMGLNKSHEGDRKY